MSKSETDKHWNERAAQLKQNALVNIGDSAQRDVELHYILPHLKSDDVLLEVGCGNGFVTELLRKVVRHVDAFDYAENMIERAKKSYGEENNRFFHDNVLAPANLSGPYDAVLCVRVLINLRDMEEQERAIRNLANALKPGGRLLLVVGCTHGFESLSAVRQSVGMSPLQPAQINFYSRKSEVLPVIEEFFELDDTFHTGMFDILTRVVYPALVGEENAGVSDFHTKIAPIAKVLNPEALSEYARLEGMVLVRK